MKSLIAFARKVYRYRFKIRWYIQYRKTIRKRLYYEHLKPLPIEELEKVLIIAPHADDEWIGTSTIIKSSMAVDILYMEYYGDNYSKSNIQTRQREIKNSSIANKFNLISIDSDHRSDVLKKIILAGSYTSIFIPSYIDWHPEHRETYRLFTEVYRSLENEIVSKVYCYNISVPHRNFPQNLRMMLMTKKEQSSKWHVFQTIYPSQDMPVYRLKLQERLNARNCDAYAAELFEQQHDDMFEKGLEELSNISFLGSLDNYKLLINNIFSIREKIFSE